MAHFRRKHPKEGVVQRNGDWSHPPVEKGHYKYSSVATRRRANSANQNRLEWEQYESAEITAHSRS